MKWCPSRIYVRGKEYQSNKKWLRLGLLKIKPKCGYSKVDSDLLTKIFVVIFSIHIYFFHHDHILNPYKNMKCIWMLMQNLDYSPNVHFKSTLLNDYCMFIEFHHLVNFLIQVGNFHP
jgi:hypothetical protein